MTQIKTLSLEIENTLSELAQLLHSHHGAALKDYEKTKAHIKNLETELSQAKEKYSSLHNEHQHLEKDVHTLRIDLEKSKEQFLHTQHSNDQSDPQKNSDSEIENLHQQLTQAQSEVMMLKEKLLTSQEQKEKEIAEGVKIALQSKKFISSDIFDDLRTQYENDITQLETVIAKIRPIIEE